MTRNRLVVGLSLLVLIVNTTLAFLWANARHRFQFELEMATSAPYPYPELYFDTGVTYVDYSARVLHLRTVSETTVGSFRKLVYNLPLRNFRHLEFHSGQTSGSFTLRRARILFDGQPVHVFAAAKLTPASQLAKSGAGGEEVEFTALPKADNPAVDFTLEQPFVYPVRSPRNRWLILGDGAVVVALFIFFRRRPLQLLGRGYTALQHSRLQELGRRISNPLFIEFDALSLSFYGFCGVCFLVACLANLNGSGAPYWQSNYQHGAVQKALLGEPHGIRVDEWNYQTPAILNQARRSDPFQAEHTTLGDHYIGLIGGLPLKHISTLFRPQFWGFFFLPVDYAFSVYWQSKALLIVTGLFTLLLLLTRSSIWSIAGTLWFLFSPLTQWTYSWPSQLPEMIGTLCWASVLFCYLAVGTRRAVLIAAALAGGACAINCALCGYAPHLIPLIWVALFVIAAHLCALRREVFTQANAMPRLLAVALGIGLIALVGFLVYRDMNFAIQKVTETSYPGKRSVPSGTFPGWQLSANFFDWWESEKSFPAALGNICEGTGYLWLAPFTLLTLPRARLLTRQKFAYAALWVISLVLLGWMLLPLPPIIGKLFALSSIPPTRFLPALGLANVALVSLVMAAPRLPNVGRREWFAYTGGGIALLIFFLLLLRAANQHIGGFFPTGEVEDSAVFAAALALLTIGRFRRTLALALVVASAVVFGSVNPLERGLGVFTHSDLAAFVHEDPSLLRGKWIVFSSDVVGGGFLQALGLDVYNNLRYLPDVDHFATLRAHGLNVEVFNQLGYLVAKPLSKSIAPHFQPVTAGYVTFWVAPADPLLNDLGIQYAAFDRKPTAEMTEGLVLITDHAVDGFWLYRLPPLHAAELNKHSR